MACKASATLLTKVKKGEDTITNEGTISSCRVSWIKIFLKSSLAFMLLCYAERAFLGMTYFGNIFLIGPTYPGQFSSLLVQLSCNIY